MTQPTCRYGREGGLQVVKIYVEGITTLTRRRAHILLDLALDDLKDVEDLAKTINRIEAREKRRNGKRSKRRVACTEKT